MQRSWAAMFFGAVGLFAIVLGIDGLTHVEKSLQMGQASGENGGLTIATGIFANLIIPGFLLVLGLRLLLRPPSLYRDESPQAAISERIPEWVLTGGFILVGA